MPIFLCNFAPVYYKLGEMEQILKYFPYLTENQQRQFAVLGALYEDWNAKINVISRKDIENLYEHHVLHSLAVSKVLKFTDGTTIADVGCGGGFPGIPLAIMFPECHFTLIDSTGKKLKVADAVADAIGLKNVETRHERMEDEKEKFDFIVSRAAMELGVLAKMTLKNLKPGGENALPNGIICLKGGELAQEMAPFKSMATLYDLSDWFDEEYFKTKKAIYLPKWK